MRAFTRILACVLLIAPCFANARLYTVDDALGLESLGRFYGGAVAFAPDGKALAYTRVRPLATVANVKWEYLWGNEGGDVWLQADAASAPVNLTRGAEDGSGWWAPQFSPDSKRIAMLSTRGGNVRIWVWDAQTHELKLRSTRGVDTYLPYDRPFLWIDDRHLIYSALPEGEQPMGMKVELQTPAIATREWPKVVAGKEPTASVLDSGVAPDLSKRPHSQLRVLDVGSGEESVVADGSSVSWTVSPKHDAVAYAVQTSVYTPKATEPLPLFTRETYAIGLATLDGKSIALAGDLSRDILPDSLRWSVDGDELVFLGFGADRREPPRLFRVNVSKREVHAQSLDPVDASPPGRASPQLEWTPHGVLVLAAERTTDAKPEVTARREWWLIDREGRVRCLTNSLKSVPGELWPLAHSGRFAGLAAGELWRIDPADGLIEKLTADFNPGIERLAWPAYDFSDGYGEWPERARRYREMIVESKSGNGLVLHRVDLESGRMQTVRSPAADAQLDAFCPASDAAVFHRSKRDGLRLWRSDAGKTRELFVANRFLRDIEAGAFQSFDYTGLDGAPLKAWLVLPPHYRKGERYPLLTWVYASAVQGDHPPWGADISDGGALSVQIAAAHGYAVLLPSMPLAPEGAVADPMLALPNGVLPAVDKAIAIGVADPHRIFVMGQSYGGFSTYGLIAQTDRFRAAVSLAGPSDLISLYGQFDARMRYTGEPQEKLLQSGIESGILLMGNPPWKDLGRYLRNSPIFYVDRVNTPVLIVQGDLDGVPIQQGEEFFTALYRQGKRARFVRYWGEGHVLRSPANVRDMWQRVFDWLDHPPSETAQ